MSQASCRRGELIGRFKKEYDEALDPGVVTFCVARVRAGKREAA